MFSWIGKVCSSLLLALFYASLVLGADGVINVNLTTSTLPATANEFFTVNATVSCTGSPGDSCGRINALLRHSLGTSVYGQEPEPDTAINETTGATPFYVTNESDEFPVLWSNITDPTSSNDAPVDMDFDNDGNLLIASYCTGCGGAGSSAYYIMKINYTSGANIWTNITDPSTGVDSPKGIVADSNGDVYVTGTCITGCGTLGGGTWFTAKYNGSDGSLIWSNITDLSASGDQSEGIVISSDGNVLVAGSCATCGTGSTIHIVKYNSTDGSHIWTNSSDPGSTDTVFGISIDSQDGAFIGGTCDGCRASIAYYVVKINASTGTIIWENVTGNSGGAEAGFDVGIDSQGNPILTGNCGSPCGNVGGQAIYTQKISGTSASISWTNITDPTTGNDAAIAVDVDSQDNVVVGGRCSACMDLGGFAWYMVKYNGSDGGHIWTNTSEPGSFTIAQALVMDAEDNVVASGDCNACGNLGGEATLTMAFDYIQKSNPSNSLYLEAGESYNFSWEVNATGTQGLLYNVDALFSSMESGVSALDSDNTNVCIDSCPLPEEEVVENTGRSSPPSISGANKGPSTNRFSFFSGPVKQIEIVSTGFPRVEFKTLTTETQTKEIPEIHDAHIYSYLKIEETRGIEIHEATIQFDINREWFKNNNLDKDDVVLYRYAESEWLELETLFVRELSSKFSYAAKTPGFSYFAIGVRMVTASVIAEPLPTVNSQELPVQEEIEQPKAPPTRNPSEQIEITSESWRPAGWFIFSIGALILVFGTIIYNRWEKG